MCCAVKPIVNIIEQLFPAVKNSKAKIVRLRDQSAMGFPSEVDVRSSIKIVQLLDLTSNLPLYRIAVAFKRLTCIHFSYSLVFDLRHRRLYTDITRLCK